MTPQKLRDRRRLRHQMAVYHENVRQHQESVRRNAEAMAKQQKCEGAMNAAIDLMIAQINAPFYSLLHEIELGSKR